MLSVHFIINAMIFSVLDLIALVTFISAWLGYTVFAHRRAKYSVCMARCLYQHRIKWMQELITRDIRVGDVALIANLERNIAFFASSSLLIIAGTLALFAKIENLEEIIASLPYADMANHYAIQLKLSLITFIFVIAFFNFTWSIRQYGFLNVMVGAAPLDVSGQDLAIQKYAKQMAIVQDQAGHSYNYGLRAYYFSLAAICWFVHPLLFIIATLLVIYMLFKREFMSKAVAAVNEGLQCLLEKGEPKHHG